MNALEVPTRPTLVPQLVEIVRRGLREGQWTNRLPAEHVLATRLQVSRPTLRKALGVLAREGWLRATQGSGWAILNQRRPPAAPPATKTVGVVCFVPLDQASPVALYLIEQLQESLTRAGCKVVVFTGSQFDARRYQSALRRLMEGTRADLWVLEGPAWKVEQWFARRRIPAFVAVTARQRTELPTLAIDLSAVYRHAAGLLVGRGHKRFTCLFPRVMASREDDSQQPFLEAVAPYQHRPGFAAQAVCHAGTPESVRHVARTTLQGPLRPTALLVHRAQHAMAVMSCLTGSGWRVPEDVSVLSIGYEPFLDNVTPSIAHYAVNRQQYARKLCRLVLQCARTGDLSVRCAPMMPQFHDGGSLASVGAR